MSPYREAPRRERGPLTDEQRRWVEAAERLERMRGEPWPAPALPQIGRAATIGVSADGTRILVVGKQCWLIEAATLKARPLGEHPGGLPDRVAMDDAGCRAAFVANGKMDLWELPAGQDDELVRRQVPCEIHGQWVTMSADGALVAHASDNRSTIVRVVDWAKAEVIYSFRADCDEGLVMHPAGDLLFCCQDDHSIVAVGRSGTVGRLEKAGGIAVARDGETVAYLDYEDKSVIRLGRLERRVPFSLVQGRAIRLDHKTRHYSPFLRFSPDGHLLMVHTEQGSFESLTLIDLKNEAKAYFIELNSDVRCQVAGVLAGERLLVLGKNSGGTIELRSGVRVIAPLVRTDGPRPVGGIGVAGEAGGELRQIVGLTPDLVHGQLVDPPATLEASGPALPYERPELIRPLLLGAGSDAAPGWSEGDELKRADAVERWAALDEQRGRFVVGTAVERLVDATRGLTHLIPEILHRALRWAEDQPRFGRALLTGPAVQAVCEELRAMGRVEREELFDAMLQRLGGAPLDLAPTQPEPSDLDSSPATMNLEVAAYPGPAAPKVEPAQLPSFPDEPSAQATPQTPQARSSSVMLWIVILGIVAGAATYLLVIH